MRLCGFSTGALACEDLESAVAFHRSNRTSTIELSALREWELEGLARAAQDLDLGDFDYVSVHAPSRLHELSEQRAVDILATLPKRWNIVLHPDVVTDVDLWKTLEERLCFENMDQRKQIGRTVSEVLPFLTAFKNSGFCLDLGHAHQIDPTMGVAIEMIERFRRQLRQVHVSEVTPHGRHIGLTFVTQRAFARIAHLIPSEVPVIVESVVTKPCVELKLVRNALGLDTHSLRVAS